jgi:death-on-curing protein
LSEPVFLDLAEVIEIHDDQIKRYGGRPGVFNLELLKSAVSMPPAGFGGEYLHKDIFEMAAAYLFHIVRNHPFIDGNKRTGAVAALVFLMMNGFELIADEQRLLETVLSVAERKSNKATIAQFFRDNARTTEGN